MNKKEQKSLICANCCQNLQNIYVQCLVCQDLFLCLECFSWDLQLADHLPSHSYKIHKENENIVELFEGSGWSLEEEKSLLEAVEHFGYGSWFDVADFVKSKTTEECKSHYNDFYVEGSIGQATLQTGSSYPCNDQFAGPIYEKFSIKTKLSVEEQKELGYMLLRDDFNKEYDNEAELIVCDICLHYTDKIFDTEYNLIKLNQLRERLKERKKRKEIAKQHNILYNSTSVSGAFRNWCVKRKKRNREFKLFESNFMPFAKYFSNKQFFQLFHNLDRQSRLLKHLKMLEKLSGKGETKLTGNFKKINHSLNGIKKKKRRIKNTYK